MCDCTTIWLLLLQPFNGLFSRTTWVSRYQKGKTNLDFTGARDSEWQWHQLGHMQVCTSLQTYNHASTPPLSFLQAGCPSCRPTNSVKALKAYILYMNNYIDSDFILLTFQLSSYCKQRLEWIFMACSHLMVVLTAALCIDKWCNTRKKGNHRHYTLIRSSADPIKSVGVHAKM